MKDEFRYVYDSNEETLTYFNKMFNEHEISLREYKEKLFEINVRLEELNRTKSVFSYNIDTRKNVFSPITEKIDENSKEAKLYEEIDKLTEEEDKYEQLIENETAFLRTIAKRIKNLVLARKVIKKIYRGEYKLEDIEIEKNNSNSFHSKKNDADDEFIDLEEFLD